MYAAGYVIRVTTASGRPSPFRSPLSISVAPPTSSVVNGTTTFGPPNTGPAVDRCPPDELAPEVAASVTAAVITAIVEWVEIFIAVPQRMRRRAFRARSCDCPPRVSGAAHRRRRDREVVERDSRLLLLPVRSR